VVQSKNSKVRETETHKVPSFVCLRPFNNCRCFTKHYTNIQHVWLPAHSAFFSFLCYLANPNNTIAYSTLLLQQYAKAVPLILDEYGHGSNRLKLSLPILRRYFRHLITEGYLIHISKDIYVINPMLTFHTNFCDRLEHQRYQDMYQLINNIPDLRRWAQHYAYDKKSK
jgi:hypothetical protein